MGWGNPKIVDWNQTEQNISPIHFVGKYDKMPELESRYLGDLIIIDNNMYMYTGEKWEELGPAINEPILEAPKSQFTYFHNCPNCGAPMKNHKCPYCGTEDYGK